MFKGIFNFEEDEQYTEIVIVYTHGPMTIKISPARGNDVVRSYNKACSSFTYRSSDFSIELTETRLLASLQSSGNGEGGIMEIATEDPEELQSFLCLLDQWKDFAARVR